MIEGEERRGRDEAGWAEERARGKSSKGARLVLEPWAISTRTVELRAVRC